MKLIVQIPCLNESQTLPAAVAAIPRQIPRISSVEILVVDDGSRDGTAEVARELGVEHVVRHCGNRGLAAAFMTGLQACLERGADLIVNTDADNQYCGADIARLVAPVTEGRADMVVGDRQTWNLERFSLPKRILQAIGSRMVRRLSGVDVPDAVSGFRAFSREAALQLNVTTSFSYTVDTLMQAGAKRLRVASVPIRTNPQTRESRLFKSIPQFIRKQVATLAKSYQTYHPAEVYFPVSGCLLLSSLAAMILGAVGYEDRVLAVAGGLLAAGLGTAGLGALADLVSTNRKLLESALVKLRQLELETDFNRETSRMFDAHEKSSLRRARKSRRHSVEVSRATT